MARRPELVDVTAIMRMVANRRSLDEIGGVLKVVGKDADGYGRIQYRAYRYIVDELAGETRLSERTKTFQWSVSALAVRVLPAALSRLRAQDFRPDQEAHFSTDDMIARILSEERGIETLVDVLLNPRVRSYPLSLPEFKKELARENPRLLPDRLHQRLERDLGVMAYHCSTIWLKLPEGDDGNLGEMLENGTEERDEALERHLRIRAEIRRLWHSSAPWQLNDEQRRSLYEVVEPMSYMLLEELHSMLVCSGRDAMAKRLLRRVIDVMPRRDGRRAKTVILAKRAWMNGHLRQLRRFATQLRRRGGQHSEVDKWISFAEARGAATARFTLSDN